MQSLEIGDVLSTSLAIVQKNIGTFLAFVAVLIATGVVITLGSSFAMSSIMQTAMSGNVNPDSMATSFLTMIPLYFVIMIVAIVVYAFVQAGMTFTAVEHLGGRTASVGGAVSVAMRTFLPQIGASFLVGIVVVIGMMFCIVPGVIASLFFCLTTPAVVVEGLGPIDAMKRSIELTEGHKGTIFVTFLALFGILIVVSLCIIGPLSVAVVVGTSTPGQIPDPLSPGQLIVNLVSVVIRGFVTAYFTTVISVIYARIRGIREGMDVAAFSRIFA